MTVTSDVSRSGPYNGNGATTAFPFDFKVFAETDLRVTKTSLTGVDSTLVLGTDYTVAGVGDASGTVTLTTAPAGDGTDAGSEHISIRRVLSETQPMDLRSQGRVQAEVIERAHDRAVMLIQQALDEVRRSLRLPEGEAGDETLTLLPPLADRKGRSFYWDPATGAPAAGSTMSNATASAALVPFIQAASIALARDVLMATNSLEGSRLQDLSVTGAKLQNGTITTGKMAANAADHTVVASGAAVQFVRTQNGAVLTGTTTIPSDDTVPTSAEGWGVVTVSFTPKAAGNTAKIDITVMAAHSAGAAPIIVTLFGNGGLGNAIAAVQSQAPAANVPVCISFSHIIVGGLVADTYQVRIGSPTAGTITVNGASGARLFGGIAASSITITEHKA